MSRRPDLDDLDREMRDHIERETEDNVARGMSHADARAAALRTFGNVTRLKEDVRAVWLPRWVDALRQDGRDAYREVRRNPAFSLIVILTLALGIGLTSAVYSVVNAVLVRPLDYRHPDRMVWLSTQQERSGAEMMNSIDFWQWKSRVTTLEHMVAYGPTDATLVAGAEASRIRIVLATEGFWEVSGAQPLFGRLPAGHAPDALVITHALFRDRFQGDPDVIGRSVMVDGRQVTIAAVLPEQFRPQLTPLDWLQGIEHVPPAAYRTMVVDPPPSSIGPNTAVRVYQTIGALRAGVSIDEARSEIDAIHARVMRESNPPFGRSKAVVAPLQERIVGPSRRTLGVLLAAVGLVLLITCVNVANLLVSRSAARRKEIALRMAVGSGPVRIIRQLLAESLVYALIGGGAGLALASWLIDTVIAVIGPAVPRLGETTVDGTVLAVTIALSAATALLVGVGPALSLSATNVQEVLKEGGRTASASRRVIAAGRVMVAAQVALTIVLLAGAGLMFKSIWQMTTYPPGFTPDQLLTMRVGFRGAQYRDQAARHRYAEALLATARAVPGVRDAALTTGRDSSMIVFREGYPVPAQDPQAHAATVSSVSASFGPLLGMSLLKGRWFTEPDVPGAVMINESLARRDFSDREAVGARIRLPWRGAEGWGTVVGVISELKYAEIDADSEPELFFHHAETNPSGVTVIIRTDGDPIAEAPRIRQALSAVDPMQSLYSVRTLEAALAESIAPRRFNLLLLATFALVALVLSVVGVYGVVAYAVTERTHEIGIRLALGARRARLVGMIVRQGMVSVVTGTAVGLLAAVMATRLIAGLLYGVPPTDVPTFVLVTAGLVMIALIACAAPAVKAAHVDPVIALRAE